MAEEKKSTMMEKLMSITTSEFISEVKRIFTHTLSDYIDYEKYLDGTEQDILSALRIIGKAKIRPSEAEQQAFRNEHREASELDSKLEEYIKEHTVPCLLLERTTVLGQPYWIVVVEGKESLIKTPAENLVDIELN